MASLPNHAFFIRVGALGCQPCQHSRNNKDSKQKGSSKKAKEHKGCFQWRVTG